MTVVGAIMFFLSLVEYFMNSQHPIMFPFPYSAGFLAACVAADVGAGAVAAGMNKAAEEGGKAARRAWDYLGKH